MPTLQSPEWLLLLPALAFVAWYWPRPRLSRPLRAAALVLPVVALAGPRLAGRGEGIDLWVLADRSASARDLVVPRLDEIEGLLESGRSRDDRSFFVDFAEEVRRREASEEEVFSGGIAETRIATAARFALASMDPQRSSRILLLSDGYSTEPLDGLSERLARQNVPLDVRLLAPLERRDFAVERIEIPTRGRPLQPFAIDVRFRGDEDGELAFVLERNGIVQTRGNVHIRDGTGGARFSDRLPEGGGAIRYTARLAASDELPGNDAASAWIEVDAGPRLLLVTAYGSDPLVSALERQGFGISVVTDPRALTLGHLAGARAVVLNNVPATHLPSDFLHALDSFVELQGGGLLMGGGAYSFGSGGYFRSPLDPLLPVSMELREEHRLMSVAMAIVMDRSGSMAVGVEGGRTKMDLANEGAARSIELLGPSDAVAVFAVDSEAHEIVPLTPLGGGADAIVDKVRRIESRGGGIYVYEGLSAAWKALQPAVRGQRHVILFSDAADSEEPGDYQRLVAEMVAAEATVSVIGLGSERDVDADLLKDVASRGKGRIFFNADPATLPALFAQETVAVARSAFIEEPVVAEPSAGWLEIASSPLAGLDAVDGYNLSYLREEATGALFSKDEYEAPLVAFWNRGAGRVAAVSFPLGGAHSDRVRGWSGYGDFVQTLARWLMGEDVPPGIGLETHLDGTVLQIDVWFDESWEERLARTPAEIFVADEGGEVESLLWERLEPGHFHAERPLRSGSLYRGAVRVGGATLPFGPIAAPGGAEWSFDRERLAELRSIARASGGVERTELASVWEERVAGSDLDLRPLFLWTFLGVFLLDAFVTRVGWRMPELDLAALGAALRREPVAKSRPEKKAAPVEEPPPEPAAVAAPSAAEKRRERFARAKDGR